MMPVGRVNFGLNQAQNLQREWDWGVALSSRSDDPGPAAGQRVRQEATKHKLAVGERRSHEYDGLQYWCYPSTVRSSLQLCMVCVQDERNGQLSCSVS
jgi:hypothetical protein